MSVFLVSRSMAPVATSQTQIGVVVLFEVATLVAVGRHAVETDPLPVRRDGEFADAIARVVGKTALLARVEVVDPQAGDGRRRISRLHGELLVGARAVVAIDTVGRHEVDALPVRRPLPARDAGGVPSELRRFGDVAVEHEAVEVADGDRVDLFVARAAGRVDNRLAVFAEREIRDAFARVGDAAGFSAVDAHHENLIAGATACRAGSATTSTTPSGAAGRGRGGGVTIGEKRDEAAVA